MKGHEQRNNNPPMTMKIEISGAAKIEPSAYQIGGINSFPVAGCVFIIGKANKTRHPTAWASLVDSIVLRRRGCALRYPQISRGMVSGCPMTLGVGVPSHRPRAR